MKLLRRVVSVAVGAVGALAPTWMLAAEEAGRALEQPAGSGMVILATLGAVGLLFLVSALGWLYQQKRQLHWRFQDADAPAEHH